MQHNGLRVGQGQQFGIELIGTERTHPIQSVIFLAHGCPGIGDEHIGAGGGTVRIVGEGDRRACLGGARPHGGDHGCVGFETGRCGDGDMYTRRDSAEHQRVGHIVGAVTEIGHPQA